MKEFLRIMEKDYQEEGFSAKEWVVYGIVAPLVLLAIMGIAGWMETACI